MGFLNNLLNPVKHVRNSLDSTKHLLHGDLRGAVASSPLINQGNSDPTRIKAAAAIDPNDPSQMGEQQYGGDPSDPAYGSFTQPFDVEQFYNYADPGYAFELQQGTQSLQNAASAGSGAFSGAALKDLLAYSQGFARTGYNDAFNRYQTQQGNIFSRLSDIAHLGQNAAANVGSQGTALAGNAGQFTSNAGSAAGAGIVGAGNAVGNGLTNYWLMKQFNQPQPVSGGTPRAV
jgi:hypothetical protein